MNKSEEIEHLKKIIQSHEEGTKLLLDYIGLDKFKGSLENKMVNVDDISLRIHENMRNVLRVEGGDYDSLEVVYPNYPELKKEFENITQLKAKANCEETFNLVGSETKHLLVKLDHLIFHESLNLNDIKGQIVSNLATLKTLIKQNQQEG